MILDKTCLTDTQLSWAAKGLHAYLISLPDDWQVRVSDLQKRSTNGRDAVRGIINELEHAGYIQKKSTRDCNTGRFGNVEFLVLESPSHIASDLPPETGIQSPDINNHTRPCPENPSPVIPETEVPAPVTTKLININRINNNKLNNKAAALVIPALDNNDDHAAAGFFQNANPKTKHQKGQVSSMNAVDLIIHTSLTDQQRNRIDIAVKNLMPSNPQQLKIEIEFSVLNSNSFKACGKDFVRKLNAICAVIKRGEWQTPAELILETSDKINVEQNQVRTEINAARAEMVHFQKLMDNVNDSSKAHFAKIISNSQALIERLSEKLTQIKLNNDLISKTN